MAADSDLASRRAEGVIASFAAAHGRGWQVELERLTGIHQTTLSKISKVSRGAGSSVIAALVQGLGIDPAFFYDTSLGESPNYETYRQSRESRVETDALTPEELERLTGMLGSAPTHEEMRWVLAAPHHRMDVRAMFIAIDSSRRGMTPEQHAAMEAETARFSKR